MRRIGQLPVRRPRFLLLAAVFLLLVAAPPRPAAAQGPQPTGFSLACNPSSLSVAAGSSTLTTCTVTSLSTTWSHPVSLSCINLPASVSCVFNPTVVTPPAGGSSSSSLTVAAGAAAAPGTFTFQARGIGGLLTRTTNISLHVTVASPTDVFFDNFEANKGWVVNPNGTDTATSGVWERGDPEQTSSGGVITQLGTTVSGTNDLVTGRLAGASAGVNDVDGGTTSIWSPAISLPASGTLTLSLRFYFSHLNNATSEDSFRIRIVWGSNTTTVFQELGAPTNDPASFTSIAVPLNSFAGQTIRILIETTDAGTASLIEAAVDDVKVKAQ